MEEENYKGYIIKIDQDEDPLDPRENDNLGKMYCLHKRYTLGDKHDYNSESFGGWEDFKNTIIKDLKEKGEEVFATLPLYLYDHSGIWMNTSRNYPFNCPWDSCQVGWIVTTGKRAEENFPDTPESELKEKVLTALEQEVKSYSNYISGQIYQYTIIHRSIIEDSGGNWENYSDALEQAKKEVDGMVEVEAKNAISGLKHK